LEVSCRWTAASRRSCAYAFVEYFRFSYHALWFFLFDHGSVQASSLGRICSSFSVVQQLFCKRMVHICSFLQCRCLTSPCSETPILTVVTCSMPRTGSSCPEAERICKCRCAICIHGYSLYIFVLAPPTFPAAWVEVEEHVRMEL